jgi:hypothetical protein
MDESPRSHSSLTVCRIWSTNPSKFSLTVKSFGTQLSFLLPTQDCMAQEWDLSPTNLRRFISLPKLKPFINVDSIVIPCFVFPHNILEDPSQTPVLLAGMSNLFLLWKTVDNVDIPEGLWLPFPSKYDCCHLNCGYTEQFCYTVTSSSKFKSPFRRPSISRLRVHLEKNDEAVKQGHNSPPQLSILLLVNCLLL